MSKKKFTLNIGKVVERFDGLCARGLCSGVSTIEDLEHDDLGNRLPGQKPQFCVEAAIAIATGETTEDDPHDHPTCVDPALAELKISLNDDGEWKDDNDRAASLRDLGIAQLGTREKGFWKKFQEAFVLRLQTLIIEKNHPKLRGKLTLKLVLDAASDLCEIALIGDDFSYYSISETIEASLGIRGRAADLLIVQLITNTLIELKTPGAKWLVRERNRKARARRRSK